jgi:metal-responsive CopG/Arc/MetJ family transcriptional regulator
MRLPQGRTVEKRHAALYLDKDLYDRLDRLRAETKYKSWNALVIVLLEQALAEIEKEGASDDAEK